MSKTSHKRGRDAERGSKCLLGDAGDPAPPKERPNLKSHGHRVLWRLSHRINECSLLPADLDLGINSTDDVNLRRAPDSTAADDVQTSLE